MGCYKKGKKYMKCFGLFLWVSAVFVFFSGFYGRYISMSLDFVRYISDGLVTLVSGSIRGRFVYFEGYFSFGSGFFVGGVWDSSFVRLAFTRFRGFLVFVDVRGG